MPRLGGKKKAVIAKKRGNLRGSRIRNALKAGAGLAMKVAGSAFASRRPLIKAMVATAGAKALGSVLTRTYNGVTRHSNSEGYIPSYSKVMGNTKTGLSFSEKIQKIMNPPQTLLYNSTQQLGVTSGIQTIAGFQLNNTFWNDFFTFIQPIRSDNSVVSNTNYLQTQATNRANHHWTSVLHTFLNSGNTSAELDIYIYQAQQDIDSADQAVTALASWAYAEQINALNGVSIDGTGTMGKKPTDFSSKLYIQRYWKLISSNSVKMKPGESYKHYFRQHYNRQIAKYMLNEDTAAAVKGHSLSFVYVLKGQVVGSSATTDISTGDAQISLVRQVKTQFSYTVNNRARDFTVGNNLAVIPTANQLFINTDTSAQQTGVTKD